MAENENNQVGTVGHHINSNKDKIHGGSKRPFKFLTK